MKKEAQTRDKFIFLIFLAFVVICFAFLNFQKKNLFSLGFQEKIQELLKKSSSFEDFYFNTIKSNVIKNDLKSGPFQELLGLYSNFLVENKSSILISFCLYLKDPQIYYQLKKFVFLFKELSLDKIFQKEFQEKELLLSFLESQDKKYLVIFQDSLIERPSGGIFLAYTILGFDKDNYYFEKVSHILDLDLIFSEVYLPYPILSSVTDRLLFHDAGWYLETESMKDLLNLLEENPNFFEKKIDDLIIFNINLFKDLLEIVGPINIQNEEINQDNVLSIVREKLFSGFNPKAYLESSKFFQAFLGEIVFKIKNLKKEKIYDLAQFLERSLQNKEIQLLLTDQKIAQFLEENGLFYRPRESKFDYLAVAFVSNKENVLGKISNKKIFLNSEILEDNTKNTLSIPLDNDYYLKIYLPLEAKIEKIENCFLSKSLNNNSSLSYWPKSYDQRIYDLKNQVEIYEENGKMVLGCYGLKNQEVKIDYLLNKGEKDIQKEKRWQLIFQKQSGQNILFRYNIKNYNQLNFRPTLFGLNNEIILDKDLEINFYLNQE